MPKDIVQYKKEILPSGKGSEYMTPYVKPRPTMPIQAGTVVPRAIARAAGTVADVALDWMKINIELEQQRQNVVAENVLNNFARKQIDDQPAWEGKYRGIHATPTTLKERNDTLDSDVAEILELQTDMNATTKAALSKGLNFYVRKYRLESSNYIQSQVKVVERENIDESKKRLIFEIENGEKTVKQAEVAHKLAFQNNHGHPDLLKQHNLLFQEAYEKARYDNIYNFASAMATRDEAEAFVKKQKLGSDEPKMLRDIKTAFETQEAKVIKLIEEIAKKTSLKGLGIRNKLELTPEIIKEITETPGIKNPTFWYNAINEQNKAIRDRKNLPYTESNGKAVADLIRDEQDATKRKLTATEVIDLATKDNTISMDFAKSFILTTSIRKDPIFINTETALKIQFGYEGLLTGFGAKPLGALYYNNAISEILTDLAETPLKGMELRDRIYELAAPYLKEYWLAADENQDEIDKRLKLMGVKLSPAAKLIPVAPVVPVEEKVDYKYIPGQGLIKQ